MGIFRKAKSALEQVNQDRKRAGWRRVGLTVLVALCVGAAFCAILYWLV